MPDKAKINKFLTEYFGKCWHEIVDTGVGIICYKCNIATPQHTDFFTWDGFGELIGLMKEKDRWNDFLYYHGPNIPKHWDYALHDRHINPDTFAPAVAAFLGYKED